VGLRAGIGMTISLMGHRMSVTQNILSRNNYTNFILVVVVYSFATPIKCDDYV